MATAQPNERHEAFSSWIWTLVIGGFFSIQAVIWVFAITLTYRDPSFAVAPRYEQEAENWDAFVARRQASRELGWAIEFIPVAISDRGRAELRIRLADRNGQPVDGAQIELCVFHCARAAEIQKPQVQPLGQGLYVVAVQLNRNGFWKLSGFARRENELFCFDQKQRFDVSEDAR